MSNAVIVVAGGIGSRMQSHTPKQFLLLIDKPVLFHTIEAFFNWDNTLKIILVLPAHFVDEWKKLIKKFAFDIPHSICTGGYTRFHSVLNGLQLVEDENAIVAIHDGVRPLVSRDTIGSCFDAAMKKDAAIPVIELKDAIRKVSKNSSEAVNREDYRIVQTPQCFKVSLLKEAYGRPYKASFTDDASVAEAAGNSIELIEGNPENIKITTSSDILFAEALLRAKSHF